MLSKPGYRGSGIAGCYARAASGHAAALSSRPESFRCPMPIALPPNGVMTAVMWGGYFAAHESAIGP